MQTRKTWYCHRMQMFWSFLNKERDLCRRQSSIAWHAYTYTICWDFFALLNREVEQRGTKKAKRSKDKERRNQSCKRQIRFELRWRRLVFTIYFHTGNPCEREWSFAWAQCALTPHSRLLDSYLDISSYSSINRLSWHDFFSFFSSLLQGTMILKMGID